MAGVAHRAPATSITAGADPLYSRRVPASGKLAEANRRCGPPRLAPHRLGQGPPLCVRGLRI